MLRGFEVIGEERIFLLDPRPRNQRIRFYSTLRSRPSQQTGSPVVIDPGRYPVFCQASILRDLLHNKTPPGGGSTLMAGCELGGVFGERVFEAAIE